MAEYITIVDTIKIGWITVKTNDLYTNGTTLTKELNIIKSCVASVDIQKDGGTFAEFVQVHTNIPSVYDLSNDTSQVQKFYVIESVNASAVTSIEDLKTKILALLT